MVNKISLTKAVLIFLLATIYFYVLVIVFLPVFKSNVSINPAIYWFITGYLLFIPLFVFAVYMAKSEGNNTVKEISSALSIKSFSRKDWAYSIAGLLLVLASTGAVIAGWSLLEKYCNVGPLASTPWFMEIHPLKGPDALLLLVWLPMFVFNIVGEEVFWRGYIQKRLQIKNSWLVCSLLWFMFHVPFGVPLMIILIPVILIIPYAFNKTKNTLVGIFIHGMCNGPVFVAVALGLIK